MATPTDPGYASQGQFNLLGDIETIWDEFTGSGIKVAVYDDGVQYTHEDLAGNYDASLHFTWDHDNDPNTPDLVHDPLPNGSGDGHGTACAGIIAGVEGNGLGGVGVAHGASITGVDFLNEIQFGEITEGGTDYGITFIFAALEHAANFDVMSNSWGSTPNYNSWQDLGDVGSWRWRFADTYETIAETGRGGLGTIVVQAAGNDGRNANGDGINTSRHTITVGATDLNGDTATVTLSGGTVFAYSNWGTSLLISAPAVNYTTDLTGGDGYSSGNYTQGFNGTSAATPVISGVVALMLEANESLGWRDVQNILAASAKQTGSAIGGVEGTHELGTWETSGAQSMGSWNGGGFTYHVNYGFGMVDAFTAVRMAEVWLEMFDDTAKTSANEQSHFAINYTNVTIIDAAGPTTPSVVTSSLVVAQPVDIEIEKIYVTIDVAHSNLSSLLFSLTAPDGTIVPFAGLEPAPGTALEWTFSITALLGYAMNGTWTLTIVDLVNDGISGTLFDFSLEFFGSEVSVNDVHFITDDFLTMTAYDANRAVISDTNGGTDTLNMVGIQNDVALQMAGSGTITVNGALWGSIAAGTLIENAFMGDGNDTVIGNGQANLIAGMRGNDELRGGNGFDTLRGGQGDDTLLGENGWDNLDGGDGDDSLDGANGNDSLVGAMGDDTLEGGANNDTLEGDNGRDMLIGGTHNDSLLGGTGADTLLGGDDHDFLSGGDQNDSLVGGFGRDTLDGGNNNDILKGENGNDLMGGGDGNDTMRGGKGDDSLDGGDGIDRLFGDGGRDIAYGGLGDDSLVGGGGRDTLYGEGDDDQLFGDGGWDKLYGGDNNDTLNGGNGYDTLEGGAGDDVLNGARHHDTLVGGSGADTFVFELNMGRDVVSDFEDGIDTLQIDSALFAGTLTVEQLLDTYAFVYGGNTIIDFGGGHKIKVLGIADTDLLLDDITIV